MIDDYTFHSLGELAQPFRNLAKSLPPCDLYAVAQRDNSECALLQHEGVLFNATWVSCGERFLVCLREHAAGDGGTGPLLSLLMESQIVSPVGSPEALPVKGVVTHRNLTGPVDFVAVAAGPNMLYGRREDGTEMIVSGDFVFQVRKKQDCE